MYFINAIQHTFNNFLRQHTTRKLFKLRRQRSMAQENIDLFNISKMNKKL